MTRQEIQALIDAKIKGQGTAVDAGSVLPAILTGILDLIEQGGGGTSDAVQYIPQELTAEQQAQARTNIGAGTSNFTGNPVLVTGQELTESQQMQARKNQGLYYSEGTPAGVISWDGNTEGKERIELEEGSDIWLYKIADSPVNIPAEKISSVLDANGDAINMQIQDASNVFESGRLVFGHAYSVDYQQYYSIAIANNPQNPSDSSIQAFVGLTGIYVTDNVRTIEYDAYDGEVHHIEPKYIKDMYYEETNEGEIDVNIPNPDEWPYSDSIYLLGMDYLRVSGETPQQSDITAIFRIEGQDVTVDGVDLEIKTTGYGSKLIAYQAPDSSLAETKFLIVPEDTTIEGVSTPKGIYFPQISSYANNHIESISFPGTITTVHQIPAKYVPQTVPAVKIEIPSNDKVSYGIGYVLLNNYVTDRDVVFSIEGKTINQVAVRNMLDTTSTGDVWDFGTGNTYNFDTSGYYLVEIEVQETPSSSAYYYATVFVETINQ